MADAAVDLGTRLLGGEGARHTLCGGRRGLTELGGQPGVQLPQAGGDAADDLVLGRTRRRGAGGRLVTAAIVLGALQHTQLPLEAGKVGPALTVDLGDPNGAGAVVPLAAETAQQARSALSRRSRHPRPPRPAIRSSR
jgi:hypothetical protein